MEICPFKEQMAISCLNWPRVTEEIICSFVVVFVVISVDQHTILFWVNGHPMAAAINIKKTVMVIYEVFVVVTVI